MLKGCRSWSGLTVAEKIVSSSLRSLSAEERGPVERTFVLLGVFPELCTIPMAVLDSIVVLDEEELLDDLGLGALETVGGTLTITGNSELCQGDAQALADHLP